MNACTTIDIGPNMTSILMLAGPTLSVVLIAVAGRIRTATKSTAVTVQHTADTAERTAQAVDEMPAAVAAAVSKEITGPTPVVAPFDIRDRPLGE